MKKNRRYVSIILAITVIIAFASYIPRSIRGNGDVVKETRIVRDFDEITLHTIGTISVSIGDETSVRIEGESNITELIETNVTANELMIRATSRRDLNPTEPVTYYITVPTLEAVTVTSSGNIEVSDVTLDNLFNVSLTGSGNISFASLQVEELTIRHTASGKIVIDTLNTPTLKLDLSGSGSVSINGGTVDVQDIFLSASGRYDAPQLISRDAEVRMTGSGSASIHADEDVNARLTGSGNLYYEGLANIEEQVTGSGKVIQQDF